MLTLNHVGKCDETLHNAQLKTQPLVTHVNDGGLFLKCSKKGAQHALGNASQSERNVFFILARQTACVCTSRALNRCRTKNTSSRNNVSKTHIYLRTTLLYIHNLSNVLRRYECVEIL